MVHNRGPKLLLDLVSLAGGQTFGMLFGFLTFAYLARTLNPTTYGAVEYAMALSAFFAILVECGLGPVAAAELARDRKRAQGLATQIPGARLILASAAVPAMVMVSRFAGSGEQFGPLIWLFALSLLAIPWKHDWLLQGLDKMTSAAMAQTTRMAAFAIAVLLMVHKPDDLAYVGLAELGAAGVGVIYYLVAQYRFLVPSKFGLAVSDSWRLIREGMWVSMSSILWAFVLYMPLFLIAVYMGSAETAWYGAPQRIVVSLLNFSFIYFFNFYPVIAARLSRPDEWSGLILSSYRLVAWTGIGVSLLLALSSEFVSTVAFGSGFAPAAPVFALLIWVLPIRLLSGHARWALVAGQRHHFLLLSELIGAIVLVVVGIITVPVAASKGAALAAVLANLANWISAHIFATRHVGRLPGFRHLLAPTAAAAAGVVFALLIVDLSSAVSIITALFVYIGCAMLFGRHLFADLRRLAYSKQKDKS